MAEEPKAQAAWPRIVNFRDAGGHPGTGGRTVRRGRLFRGSSLHAASDDDLAKLAGLGVGLVFDLRSRDEAAGRPDRLPPGVRYRREPAVISMDENPRESLDWDALIDYLGSSEEALADYESFQYGVYAEMIRRPQAFQALLGELLEAPRNPAPGVYVHCSAGKDRTGVAIAIVLRLLGVSRADTLADYLASAAQPMPEFDSVTAKARQCSPRIDQLLETMMGVSPAQFDLAFAEAKRVWGSWAGFVQRGLGLTDTDVTALQAAYLASA